MTPFHRLSDFDFELPPELIAQDPIPQRSAARLMDATGPAPVDRSFSELPSLLRAGDLVVFNDTRVIKARLLGAKSSGGAVQALIERVLGGHDVLAHLRASKSPRPGTQIRFADAFDARVLGREGPHDALFRLRFPDDPFVLLDRHGHMPLPPYIQRSDNALDEERYQTVFAAKPGAVAAPTAALHFDAAVLAELSRRGIPTAAVTLHVGAGTFQPVRTDNLADHVMHSEWFDVPPGTVEAIQRTRARGGRIVAVGTTTLRALESASRSGNLQSGSAMTNLFITPGFDFHVVDILTTNFHLPKSTLMMLVSAFAGVEHVRELYRRAIASNYRFFSYGDAMLLSRSCGK